MSHQPEALNLWDRLFNRYRREVANRGEESYLRYTHRGDNIPIPGSEHPYTRHWVEYRIIDRLTGSERIERDYLNHS